MSANTPKGLPYPVETDPYADGNEAIQALATAVDSFQPARQWVGGATITITNAVAANAIVTLPAGRFGATPRVQATVQLTSVYFATIAALSATSVTVTARHADGTVQSATVNVALHAVQMLANAGDG